VTSDTEDIEDGQLKMIKKYTIAHTHQHTQICCINYTERCIKHCEVHSMECKVKQSKYPSRKEENRGWVDSTYW